MALVERWVVFGALGGFLILNAAGAAQYSNNTHARFFYLLLPPSTFVLCPYYLLLNT